MSGEEVDKADLFRLHERLDEMSAQNVSSIRDLDDEMRSVKDELHKHIVDGVKKDSTLMEMFSEFRLGQQKLVYSIDTLIGRVEAREKVVAENEKDERGLRQSIKKWGAITFFTILLMLVWAGIEQKGQELHAKIEQKQESIREP